MKLLVSADLHIGRRSSRLPAHLAAEYTPGALWQRMCEEAVSREVDAVLLAGDLVERDNAFFEALGPLEAGLRRLAEAGIGCYAVAGNHDVDCLERLARGMSAGQLTVIGSRGRWERVQITGKDSTVLHVYGWSFPSAAVHTSPLPQFPAGDVEPGVAALGLLHAELGVPGSSYCPVRRDELLGTGINTWVLGHIHKPTPHESLSGPDTVLVPGSPQGLDPGPGERGVHGPWLVSVKSGRFAFEQLALAPVRYELLPVELKDCAHPGDVQERLLDALSRSVAAMAQQQPGLRCAVLRLEVTGQVQVDSAAVRSVLGELSETPPSTSGIELSIDSSSVCVLPQADLVALAEEPGPLGEAAKLLRELEGCEPLQPDTQTLIAGFQQTAATLCSENYRVLQGADGSARVDGDASREWLRAQCARLVEELWRQQIEAADSVSRGERIG